MTRYISDQNKVVILHESGTYAVPLAAGRWPGEVQDFTLTENEGYIEDRYLGNASRSYGNFANGPIDVTGKITLNAQDMLLVAHAIGSVAESNTSGRNTVIVTEVNSDVLQNPFVSGTSKSTTLPYCFTVEDSKQSVGTGKNFIRQAKGLVLDTVSLKATQGEKVSIEADLVGQTVLFKSGTTTAVTANTRRPYLWSDVSLTLGGTVLDTAKDISFEVANNVEPPHYINGSRVIAEPYMGNRDYTLTITSDLDSTLAKTLYETYYQGGTTFNVTFDLNADNTAGSQHAIFALSGCKVTAMEVPSTIEGANENTLTIRPQNVSATIYDDATKVGSYNPY